MEDKTLNELKQIKIQDQIRDIKNQDSELRKKRRRTIGGILQLLAGMFAATLGFNIVFVMGIFMEIFTKNTPSAESYTADIPFSPPSIWYWTMAIGLIFLVILIIRIFKLSETINDNEIEIYTRQLDLDELSGQKSI